MMMSYLRLLFLALACTVIPAPAHAVLPDEVLSDPALESRARTLSRELRCMVCQNQSIDDSDAPLARDLRLLVRERLKAGDSDDQVRSFLVERYGAFVLLRPPFTWTTALLWSAPAAVLVFGGLMVAMHLRRRRQAGADPARALAPDEERRIEELLRASDNVTKV